MGSIADFSFVACSRAAAAVMALPFLDCFLDSKGQALGRDRPADSHALRHLSSGAAA